MKTLNRVIAVTMFAVPVLIRNVDAATNTVYSTVQTVGGVEMTPEQQLVYAVTNAAAGDVVLIKPGKYTFSGTVYSSTETVSGKTVTNLLDSAKRVSIIGDTDLSRKDWSDGAEPVIIDVSGRGRLFRLRAKNCSVHNLTVTGCTYPGANGFICQGSWDAYPVFTNCVFRNTSGNDYAFHRAQYDSLLYDCAYTNNSAYLSGGKGVYGCDFIGNTLFFTEMNAYGCWFEANSSTWYLDNPLVLSNCSFVAYTPGNSNLGMIRLTSEQTTQISDCVFEKNTNTLIRAAFKESNSACVEISRCTFTSNVIANANNKRGSRYVEWLVWNKTNDFTSATAAQSRFLVKDTIFEGNCYKGGYGMAEVFGVTATGCTFRAFSPCRFSPDSTYYAMSACNSRLECCDISGGELTDCVVDRCTLHDVGSLVYACFRDYCRATNTLVVNCGAMLYWANNGSAAGRHDAEFVNCTFAGNNAQIYGSQYDVDSANDFKFVNCLFNSNTNGNGVATDFSMQNESGTLNCWTSKVSFDHCFYGKFTATGNLTEAAFEAKTNGVDTLSLCVDPKFAKDSRTDAPYWSLLSKSPLVGKGDASIWTAEDVDLAGNLRLKDGKVDIGCYQCWLREPGMMIFVR